MHRIIFLRVTFSYVDIVFFRIISWIFARDMWYSAIVNVTSGCKDVLTRFNIDTSMDM